jgi:transglutaminase-like putative cysteine protease
MIYFIRHITRYRYSAPIRESIMEARMQPRSDGNQHCIEFRLDVTPKAKPTCYHDHLENAVHHFDIPGEHDQIFLQAEATVEVKPLLPMPEFVPHLLWHEIDALVNDGVFWDLLQPSAFVQNSPLVDDLAAELQVDRRDDPLTTLLRLNRSLYEVFSYVPQSTKVDSSIDVAIEHRRGVCQDFSHIMIALVRRLGIPCRYVSGYLYHVKENHDRSEDDASHAWVEAYLPGLCWRGFDPTNNLVVGERHIRVAAGRDYADVPPTRGVFKGMAASELGVSVSVTPSPIPITPEGQVLLSTLTAPAPRPSRRIDQQQQQQQ